MAGPVAVEPTAAASSFGPGATMSGRRSAGSTTVALSSALRRCAWTGVGVAAVMARARVVPAGRCVAARRTEVAVGAAGALRGAAAIACEGCARTWTGRSSWLRTSTAPPAVTTAAPTTIASLVADAAAALPPTTAPPPPATAPPPAAPLPPTSWASTDRGPAPATGLSPASAFCRPRSSPR